MKNNQHERTTIPKPKLIIEELSPIPVNTKGFNSKAKTIYDPANGVHYLLSYETIVMAIDKEGSIHRFWDSWSMTTARHINAFLQQHRGQKMTKAQWLALPVEELSQEA